MYKERIQWVDTLKVVGIFAVILGHIKSPLGVFIYSFHMPLFFFISGFFIKLQDRKKDVHALVLKDFNRLMVPYYFFSLLGLLVEVIKRSFLERESLNYAQEFKGLFFNMNIDGLINHYGFVLWFLPSLFIAKMLLCYIFSAGKNVIYGCLISFAVFLISFQVVLPFGLSNGMNSVCWILLGYVYFHVLGKSNLNYQFVIGVLLMSVGYFIIDKVPAMDLARIHYENVLANVLWALGVILSFVSMIRFIVVLMDGFLESFASWLAKASMFLFVFHPYTNNFSHIVIEGIIGDCWLLKFLLSLSILYIGYLLKNRLPEKGMLKYV